MYYDWVVISGLACQVQEPQRGRGRRGGGAGRDVEERVGNTRGVGGELVPWTIKQAATAPPWQVLSFCLGVCKSKGFPPLSLSLSV